MLVRLHVHAPATKAHAFRLKPESLFNGMIAAEFDLSTCAEHALPWESEGIVEHTGD